MGFTPTKPALPVIPPSAHPPVLASALSNPDQLKANAKAAEGMGFDGTVKTSPQGLTTPPATAKATLLGQ